MKSVFAFTLGLILMLSVAPAQATDAFWQAAGDYVERYGAPCLAGLAAGYVIDHDKGLQIGATGCIIVFAYGEFGKSSHRTLSSDDINIVQEMINKDSEKRLKSLRDDYEARFNSMNQRIVDESLGNRQQIRNAVTDLGVFLEKDMNEKMDRKMENPKLLDEIDSKITKKVKEEVQDEFRSRESEIVEKATQKTIKRVTAEPIIIEGSKPSPTPAP